MIPQVVEVTILDQKGIPVCAPQMMSLEDGKLSDDLVLGVLPADTVLSCVELRDGEGHRWLLDLVDSDEVFNE